MTEDLRRALGAATGSPDARPDLDGLWATGRRRHRRRRMATGAVGVVALVGLAVGAIALADDGDTGQDVVAGPVDRPADAPPAEPTGTPITIDIEAGPVVDGLPTAEPGGTMTLTYGPGPYGFGRDGVAQWERWDGAAWAAEHLLVVERAGEPGSGEVLGLDVTVDSGEDRFPREADRYPTPDDLVPGWYRICVPMVAYSGHSGTVPGTPLPPMTTDTISPLPTTTFPSDPDGLGGQIRPCAQLRVPGDTTATTDTTTAPAETTVPAPPAEPDLPVSLDFGPELSPGVLVFGDFTWTDSAPGSRAREAVWEMWDGTTWTPTHQTTVTGFDDVPEIHPIDERVPVAPELVGATGRVAFLTPPAMEAPPGTYRLCIEMAITGAAPMRTLCEQITLTAPDLVMGYPDRGAATWEVDPADPPEPDDQVVTVLVTRVACTDGAAGPLLEPEVRAFDTAASITFTTGPGTDDCPTGEPVRREVDLGAPLGDRSLSDGICGGQEEGLIPACDEGRIRWRP